MSDTASGDGFRVAIVGASSLAGKELESVLKERHFPVSQMVELEAVAGSELEIPILDLDGSEPREAFNPEIEPGEIDLAFIAARPASLPSFLKAEVSRDKRPIVIDLEGAAAGAGSEAPRMALVESESGAPMTHLDTPVIAAAHPASIVICLLLLRLSTRIELSSAVAHVFSPVSHLGPRAIEELQRQTVNLLSFQKAPHAVFGGQLAFNLLPRVTGSGLDALSALQARLSREIGVCLKGRTLTPALRLLQAPVFYSLGISLYVETKVPINPARVSELLAGEGVRLRRASDAVSSQVEVTGADNILIDSVVSDAGRATGLWIWCAADNLRLAALNAVAIAEQALRESGRLSRANGKAAIH